MKQIAIIILLCIGLKSITAQGKIVCIHPEIGDTLNLKEKKNYLLFPEISNDDFSYAFIRYLHNSYYLCTYFETDSSISKIDTSDLSSYYKHIEKMSAYYTNKNKRSKTDSLNLRRLEPDNRRTTSDKLVSPEARRKIGYESERNQQQSEHQKDAQEIKGLEEEN